jgi:putative ABC transport system permease protein
MSRRQLFVRLLVRAAWLRKDRALTALISVAVVATIATAGLTVYYDLENKLSREFRSFGANVVVSKSSGTLSADERSKIAAVAGEKGAVVPVAYAIATATDGSKVVVGGADLAKLTKLNSWWAIGEPHAGNALIGSRAAETLFRGSAFKVAFGKTKAEIKPQATFHSGSDDDSRIYVPLEDFVRWTSVEPATALVRIDGRPQEIQDAITKLTAALPNAEVKPVRQITQAQTAVIGRTRSLVLAASGAVVVLIMLSMIATFTSSVLERRRDFAVMKALGASNRTVNLLFAAESSLLALAGAAAGYLLGSGVAFWIGKANFAAAIWPQPILLAPVLLGCILLALLASTAPLRMLQQIQPAGILRGE